MFLEGEDVVESSLLLIAIFMPAVSAILCYMLRKNGIRKGVVVFSLLVMFAVSAGLMIKLVAEKGINVNISFGALTIYLDRGVKFLDLALLGCIIYIGVKLKKKIILAFVAIQAILFALFEIFNVVKESDYVFVIDNLSLIMILLVSIIGSIITFFSVGYMDKHEHHLKLDKSKQPRFFAVLFLFLSAMNALVMSDNLLWMYFFWEITTICSFLLISHDQTEESIKNGVRALWINLVGGVAFMLGIMFIYGAKGTLSVQEIISSPVSNNFTGYLPIGLGLLCFAGFTKAALFPFQSWLLGAMVAPTPVSALLHSSTMVKAGVYLIVRISPAFTGTILGKAVAVVGGFTFLAASFVAISQSNGKRVLAYSTIANLGLIVCCAGIGSNVAVAAAVMLMVFHAISKGLLFLCVGTVEQEIGSRDIEDMQGLMKKMPFTTITMVIAMISMLLPPFGVLITKWLAIEASVELPLVLALIVLGSAFTVVFWSKWIGIILTMSYKAKYQLEKMSVSMKLSLAALLICLLEITVFMVPFFNIFINPYTKGILGPSLSGNRSGLWWDDGIRFVGSFNPLVFLLVVFAVMILVPYFIRKTKPESVKQPYLCGENTNDIRGINFVGPGDKIDSVIVRNYYLATAINESKITIWLNIIAGSIIFVMFGVVMS